MASHESERRIETPTHFRRLGDGRAAAKLADCSLRHWLRMAADGRAPKGVKLGALRKWDLREIEEWIEAGCPAVAEGGAG